MNEWHRASAAQGWYWTRYQQADLLGESPGPFEPIERALGPAIATVWALYERTSRDACTVDWTQAELSSSPRGCRSSTVGASGVSLACELWCVVERIGVVYLSGSKFRSDIAQPKNVRFFAGQGEAEAV